MLLVSKPSWLDEYGGPGFAMPEIAGRYAGKSLVIVGDALCVWDDLAKFGCAVRHRRGEVGKSGWDFLTINNKNRRKIQTSKMLKLNNEGLL